MKVKPRTVNNWINRGMPYSRTPGGHTRFDLEDVADWCDRTKQEGDQMQGWISLNRQVTENWIWKDTPYAKGQAWVDILLRVNHKANKVPIGNQIIDLKEGQTIWSIDDMAKSWGWSRKKVSNFLNILETESMLSQKRTSKYTLLTVENWALYQNKEHQKHIKGTSKAHQGNTNNNDNNEIIKDIVDYLNQKADKNFKHSTEKTKKHIRARLEEGFLIDDFKTVVDTKVRQWKSDKEWSKYLRPETLFGTKFESYLNEAPKKKPKTQGIDRTNRVQVRL